MATPKDRFEVAGLYYASQGGFNNSSFMARTSGPSTNSGVSNGPWKKQPTPISVPTAVPKQVANPFSFSSTRNPTAKRTLIKHTTFTPAAPQRGIPDRPSKRQKREADAPIGSKYFDKHQNGAGLSTRQPLITQGRASSSRWMAGGSSSAVGPSTGFTRPCAAAETIDVDDLSAGDVGVPLRRVELPIRSSPSHASSVDQLDFFGREGLVHDLGVQPDKIHPFHVQNRSSSRTVAEDGPSTRRLREMSMKGKENATETSKGAVVTLVDDDSDSIQEADTPVNGKGSPLPARKASPGGRTEIPKNIVLDKRGIFERQAKGEAPFLDLTAIPGEPKMKGRASNMKGKQTLNPTTRLRMAHQKPPSKEPQLDKPPSRRSTDDDVASKSTPYKHEMPLHFWVSDSILHGPADNQRSYTLTWKGDAQELIVSLQCRGEDHDKEEIISLRDVSPYTVEYSGNNVETLLLRIRPSSQTHHAGFSFVIKQERRAYRGEFDTLVNALKPRSNSVEILPDPAVRSIIDDEKHRAEGAESRLASGNSPMRQPGRSVSRPDESNTVIEVTPGRRRPRPAYLEQPVLSDAVRIGPERRSERLLQTSRSPSVNLDEVILVYPPNAPGAVNVSNADLSRLDPGNFLNDTLIELGLKFWLDDMRKINPKLVDTVHVFSSFFYKKLNTKNIEDGYTSVRKWTSKIDLFAKKYIVVPINENVHWYLAIITYPELVLRTAEPKPLPRTSKRKFSAAQPTAERSTNTGEQSQERAAANVPTTSSASGEGADMVEQVIRSTRSCSLDDVSSVDDHVELGKMEGGGPPPNIATLSEVPDSEDESDVVPSSPLTDLHDELADDTDHDFKPEVMDADAEASGTASPNDDATIGSASEPDELKSVNGVSETERPEDKVASGSIPAASFYERPSKKMYRSKASRKRPFHRESLADEEEDDHTKIVFDSSAVNDDHSTYIFTFDSLGSSHPRAAGILRQYLQLEAKDKKGVDNPSSAKYKQASVPVQPNYCDCGLYLLHFVRTFLSDPDKYREVIMNSKKSVPPAERSRIWLDKQVCDLREEMKARILKESALWKTRKGQEKKDTEADGGNRQDAGPVPAEATDDEIQVSEVVKVQRTPAKGAGRSAGRGRKGTGAKTKDEVPVAKLGRLRG